jgi:hypothetical protein
MDEEEREGTNVLDEGEIEEAVEGEVEGVLEGEIEGVLEGSIEE